MTHLNKQTTESVSPQKDSKTMKKTQTKTTPVKLNPVTKETGRPAKKDNPVTVEMAKPNQKDVKQFIDMGVKLTKVSEAMTQLIKAVFFHRNKETNQTQITKALDEVLQSEDPRSRERVAKVKKFVKRQLQTLIKAKPTQQAILGKKVDTHTVTMKKVTQPMVDNVEGRFEGNFNETDKGSFRVVIEKKKQKEQDDLLTALIKFIDSHETDTTEVREILDEIDAGAMARKVA